MCWCRRNVPGFRLVGAVPYDLFINLVVLTELPIPLLQWVVLVLVHKLSHVGELAGVVNVVDLAHVLLVLVTDLLVREWSLAVSQVAEESEDPVRQSVEEHL